MSKGYKTLKEIELDIIVKSGLIQQLKFENEKLKERINKSIEYLNYECMYDENFGYCDDLWCGDVQKLVDILKGVDKE